MRAKLMNKQQPTCNHCESTEVRYDAVLYWCTDSQSYQIIDVERDGLLNT